MSLSAQAKRILKSLQRESLKSLTKAIDYGDLNCSEPVRAIEIVLPLAMLLHSLSKIPVSYKTAEIIEWKNSITEFIKKQERNFSYSYWIRKSKFSKEFPLPDDLDDTAFCISALVSEGEKIDERVFLKIINIESKAGGPYWTWYVPRTKKFKGWQDVDPAVNSNFAYSASLYGLRLKNTEKYLLKILREGSLLSPYYTSKLVTLYYLSRLYSQTKEKQFRDLVLKWLNKYKYDKLSKIEKVFYLLSKSYLGIEITASRILTFKVEPLPFCYDFSFEKKQAFVGSKVITSALLLELIFMQEQIRSAKTRSTSKVKKVPFIVSLEKTASTFMKKHYQYHNVLSVPYMTVLTLKRKLSKNELQIVRNLSLALFYSWRGYTMLDHVVDEQKGLETHRSTDLLIKEAKKYFNKIDNKEFHKSLGKAFQISDLSFIEESLKTNRNSYDYVEKRMMPFLISMKFLPGFLNMNKSKGESLYKIFKAQMIIDQLNDDAHDWKEDLEAGRVTFVTSKLLRIHRKKHNSLFWNSLMPKVIRACTKEYEIALKAIKKLKPINNFIELVINKSYSPIRQANEAMKGVRKVIQSL